MPLVYANINPDIVNWARHRSQLSLSGLAAKLNIPEEKLEGWERGNASPTFNQAKNIANKTHIPFGYLFLDTPPQETLGLPDLRTIESQHPVRPSTELTELVLTMRERVSWYADHLRDQGIKRNPIVGRYTLATPVDEIVSYMRNILGVSLNQQRGDEDEYFRLLVKRIEAAGILVMKQRTIRNHRPLSVDEFRGFAIDDPVAPLIFINIADIKSASLFTLIHELAHILLGQSGISDGSFDAEKEAEVVCNAVAAEFLVPQYTFLQQWRKLDDWRLNIPELTSLFHTSRWVIARRAQTLGKITTQQYSDFVAELMEEYRRRPKSNGGDYYRTKNSQISRLFSEAVACEAMNGNLLLRDAGYLLDMKPPNIVKFAKELGV